MQGLPAPIAGAMVENASLFMSYNEIQNFIRRVSHRAPQERLPLYHLALAGAGAGAITSFLLSVDLSFLRAPPLLIHTLLSHRLSVLRV
jgi:hypothetical protein